MKSIELIGRQAKEIEELKDTVKTYRDRMQRIYLHLYCIGGPLNDNKLRYSKVQLGTFFKIAEEAWDE